MENFSVGFIISTYNNPDYLRKTLWGYCFQSRMADEIIIADDGSKPQTKEMIEEEFSNILNINHVWHEDIGFRKTIILNKALLASKSDYLIFTDQDCIPRNDFIETHCKYAQKGYFLSGGYFKLPISISKQVTRQQIETQELFSLKWLRANGLPRSFKSTKLINKPWWSNLMNIITPTNASWNGMNSSTWRELLIKTKGFDSRMAYGGEDRELGERLINSGIKSKQIRYSAITLHLDHSRPYVNQEAWDINNAIRKTTRKEHLTETQYGIE